MDFELGQKFLITSDWFIAPDGKQYNAVFGTVKAILNDAETLGISTNRHSANWYVRIGAMLVAGCQIHYAIRTDEVCSDNYEYQVRHELDVKNVRDTAPRIWVTD